MNDDEERAGPPDLRDAVLRGRSVELFSELESVLDSILAGYYTPRHPRSTFFQLDLPASENFSFALRRSVFESIARRHDCIDGKRIESLHKASRWRNFLAHATLVLHDYGNDEPTPKIGIRDPKTHKAVTVFEAFGTFESECKKAVAYAWEVYAKRFPSTPFGTYGHIVEEPIPPGAHLLEHLGNLDEAAEPTK